MTDSKKISKATKAAAAPSTGGAEGSFSEAFVSYARQLEEAQVETQKRYNDAYASYLASLQSVQSDTLQRSIDTYHIFIE